MKRNLAIVGIIGLMSSTVCAGELAVEHGKINTGDASPVGLGVQEVEFVFGGSTAGSAWNSSRNKVSKDLSESFTVSASWAYGLSSIADLTIGWDYQWLRDKSASEYKYSNFGDVTIDYRYQLITPNSSGYEMAVVSGVTLPSGSPSPLNSLGTSQGFTSWSNSIVATKDWDRLTSNLEVGYSLAVGRDSDEPHGALSVNWALGYQAKDWLQPEIELNYAKEYLPGSDSAEGYWITAGLVMPVSSSYRVNIGYQHSIGGRNVDNDRSFTVAIKHSF